jgi:hypothetical protein
MRAWFARAIGRGLLADVDPSHAADMFLGALVFRPFLQHIERVEYSRGANDAFVDFAVETVWNAIQPSRLARSSNVEQSRRRPTSAIHQKRRSK